MRRWGAAAMQHRQRAARDTSGSVLRLEEPEAEQGAGQVQQPLEQVGPPLVAHPEATAPQQPGLGPLDDPPVPPQPLAGVDPAPG